MIPILLSEIPSMHVCIIYLDEYFNVPNLQGDHYIFLVYLACYLALQYPMENTLNSLNNILSRLSMIINTVDDFVRNHYPTWILLMFKAFGIMKDKILRNIGKMKENIMNNENKEFKEKCKDLIKKLDFIINYINKQ